MKEFLVELCGIWFLLTLGAAIGYYAGDNKPHPHTLTFFNTQHKVLETHSIDRDAEVTINCNIGKSL